VLRTPFYVALVKAIADQGPSELRIDWQHHPRPSLFNGLLARRRAQQISRALFDDLSDHRASAIIEVTAAIARPDARHSAICLGVCDSRGELPTYAAPIHLAASPEDCLALQSSR